MVNKSRKRALVCFIQEVVTRLGKNEVELVIAILWSIWNARNRALFEREDEDPWRTVANAEAILNPYFKVHSKENGIESLLVRERKEDWSAPLDGWLKLNVDAAIEATKKVARLGMVVRKSKGEIKAATVGRSRFHGDVEQAKAEAMKFGLEIAKDSGLFPLIVESDAVNVVKLAKGMIGSKKEIYWIIKDIQDLLKGMELYKVQHASKKCNMVDIMCIYLYFM